ncbi:MAG: hypothetical protein EP332_10350 [Bacteroidetes bacterium]|nr:MAG: hypothetical protein EP332_10350 [Bacteroidota bacterium]
MSKLKYSIGILSLGLLLGLGSCSDDKPDEPTGSFDRATLLTDIAEQYILPGFDSLYSKQQVAHRALQSMVAVPNQANLLWLQDQWKSSFLAYQQVRMFNFGPGEKSIYGEMDENMATYPVNTDSIQARIARGDLNTNDFRRDTRGYLALDYLLFTATVDSFNSISFKNYVNAVSLDLFNWADELKSGWQAYASDFRSSTDKGAGSSTSELYNHFLQSFEDLKNYELGLPAGLMAGQTQVEPQLVQAYYSGYSIPLLKAHFKAIEDLWKGTGAGQQNIIGFKEYLETVVGGTDLILATESQIAAVQTALNALPNQSKLSDLIQQDLEAVKTAHTEIQKLTRFLKSDLSSLLGIAITYSSGDGD